MSGIVHFLVSGRFLGVDMRWVGDGSWLDLLTWGTGPGFGREIGESHIWRGVVRGSRRAFEPRSDMGHPFWWLLDRKPDVGHPPTRLTSVKMIDNSVGKRSFVIVQRTSDNNPLQVLGASRNLWI